MKRTTRAVPKAPPLYARICRIPELYTKLLAVAKGHALRDEFGEARTAADVMNRKLKTTLLMEGELIGYALGSQLVASQDPPEIFDAPGQISDALLRKSRSAAPGSVLPLIRHAMRGESWCLGYGLSGAMRERAGYGR